MFNDEQLTNLRQKLGVAADADAGLILGALDEALSEQAADSAADTTTPAVPEGMSLVESDQLQALHADAELGRAARLRDEEQARADVVDAAVRDGRISAARRDTWLARLEADSGEAEVLAALEPIVPLAEIGHADLNPDEVGEGTSDTYNAVYGTDQKGA